MCKKPLLMPLSSNSLGHSYCQLILAQLDAYILCANH